MQYIWNKLTIPPPSRNNSRLCTVSTHLLNCFAFIKSLEFGCGKKCYHSNDSTSEAVCIYQDPVHVKLYSFQLNCFETSKMIITITFRKFSIHDKAANIVPTTISNFARKLGITESGRNRMHLLPTLNKPNRVDFFVVYSE